MASKMIDYKARKAKIILILGGKCKVCGSVSDLQIDHIDHNKKSFCISKNWSTTWDRLLKELEKCQLLCRHHHREKTAAEGSLKKGASCQPKGVKHGTVWGYIKYKCRCDLCRKAKSNYSRALAQSG